MHTGHTLVLGSSPYWFAQLQNAFVRVSSCTCVSIPMTASYCSSAHKTQGEAVSSQQGARNASCISQAVSGKTKPNMHPPPHCHRTPYKGQHTSCATVAAALAGSAAATAAAQTWCCLMLLCGTLCVQDACCCNGLLPASCRSTWVRLGRTLAAAAALMCCSTQWLCRREVALTSDPQFILLWSRTVAVVPRAADPEGWQQQQQQQDQQHHSPSVQTMPRIHKVCNYCRCASSDGIIGRGDRKQQSNTPTATGCLH